jgi:hypothetical protein
LFRQTLGSLADYDFSPQAKSRAGNKKAVPDFLKTKKKGAESHGEKSIDW